jgi:hypothetical protein
VLLLILRVTASASDRGAPRLIGMELVGTRLPGAMAMILANE